LNLSIPSPNDQAMLIDTHAHLDYPDFEKDLEEVIAAAHKAGVDRIITIGTSLESSRRAVALAERFDCVRAVVGLHPTHVDEESEGWLEGIRLLASHPKVAAIGETGMDYHRLPSEKLSSAAGISALQAETADDTEAAIIDGAYKAAQAEAFTAQLDLAAEFGLNVVIHQRDAWDDTLDILKNYTGRLRGVFHCFGNTPDQAREILALGHLVSFTGIVTKMRRSCGMLSSPFLPTPSWWKPTAPTWLRCRIAASAANPPTHDSSQKKSPKCAAPPSKRSPLRPHGPPRHSSD
jgi:TatD DNase family protein